MLISSIKFAVLSLSTAALALVGWVNEGRAEPPGLEPQARQELRNSGLDKYVGQFEPAGDPENAGGGWDKYTFDTNGGDGPICIAGTPLTVFHQPRDDRNLLIVLDGGGACVQDLYLCSILADANPPGDTGIFADSFDSIDNPFADWSKLFVSYCDGSVFSGDNDVVDANFPFGPVRFHRGVRNLTAALDLARDLHPNAKEVLLSGISAGGYGVALYAPSIYRLVFPPSANLFVLNDSGPGLANPALGAVIQDLDWRFSQFFPASCTECSTLPGSEQGALIKWTLENDNGYKGSLYSTDGDAVIRSFTFIPTQAAYRALLLGVHDPIHAAHPDRYKRFIRSGSEEHTALGFSGFYTFEADGLPLYRWVEDFVNGDPSWVDIVEDFVPAP
jgi:hypothetical protein